MPSAVPCFCCFCISENHFWKYSRNWTKIYGEFLCEEIHHHVEGRPGGAPRDAAAPPGGAGRTRPCPLGTSSAPSDAYKIPINLKTSGGHYFPQKTSRRAVTSKPSSGVNLKEIPAPCRRGDRSRRALHRHAFLQDDL